MPGNLSTWECASIIILVANALSWFHKSHIHCFDGLVKILGLIVVIAVFTRCVIEICTRKQYEPTYKYYRFIIYCGRRYRQARGWAIFRELPVLTIGDEMVQSRLNDQFTV